MTGSANLELVTSICAAWELGDYNSAEWAHREIQLVRVDGPDPGTWTGLEGLAAATRFRLSARHDFRIEPEAFREIDDECVLVLGRLSGRGKKSGLELGQLQAQGLALFHVHDGTVTRIVVYFDRERAFAELGLPPEVGSG